MTSIQMEDRQEAASAAASDTLSERAAALIERDILAGLWLPDTRLGIHALSEHYGIGATPVREGLSRLVSRGLIMAVGKKGFRVASTSRADLEDITRVRTMVEVEALKRSIAIGGDEWEAGIVAALHRLRRCLDRDAETMREGTADFDGLHKAFHRSLLAACGSERLLRLHDELYLQAYRYRRVMMNRFQDPAWFLMEHQELADIIIARNVEEAVRRLSSHLNHTLVIVYGDAGTDKPA